MPPAQTHLAMRRQSKLQRSRLPTSLSCWAALAVFDSLRQSDGKLAYGGRQEHNPVSANGRVCTGSLPSSLSTMLLRINYQSDAIFTILEEAGLASRITPSPHLREDLRICHAVHDMRCTDLRVEFRFQEALQRSLSIVRVHLINLR